MKFREHRGGLAESIKTMIELPNHASLVEHCQKLLAPSNVTFKPSALKVTPYSGPDTRIAWDSTYIVTIDGYGVIGFTNSAC